MLFNVLRLVVTISAFVSVMTEEIFRQTSLGSLKGTSQKLNENGSIEYFWGIPYSAPPIGELRWRPPSNHPGWQDVLDATRFKPFCPQLDLDEASIQGDEDCLYLNIYIPTRNITDTSESPLPVLFWIHGTEPGTSNSDFYDSQMSWYADVILVTFNYRIGALGFLSTGDNQSPGNYGLMDQIAALRWVKENINEFGGDNTRITVAGESAGGKFSQLLALSPTIDSTTTNQLFHRVISQSGSAFSDSLIGANPSATATSFFENLGCPTLSYVLAMECARMVDYRSIVQTANVYEWKVVVDGDLLTGSPEELANDKDNIERIRGRYQFLSGVNSFDSLASYESINDITDAESFIYYINEDFKSQFTHPDKVVDTVFLNYIDWNDEFPSDPNEWRNMAINSTRDKDILSPSIKFATLASDDQGYQSHSYFYLFCLRPFEAIAATQWAYSPEDQYKWVTGARHGEELPYLFGIPYSTENSTYFEEDVSLQMMRYWGNFVKTGDPNHGLETNQHWPEFNRSESQYIILGDNIYQNNRVARIETHLESDKVVLWNEEIPLYTGIYDASDNSNPMMNISVTDPVVNTTSGKIKGLRLTREDYIIDRFFRVPYAKAPEGELRFKRPQPHPGWDGILDCSDVSSAKQWLYICPQRNLRGNGNVGREDCLNLNIWVPGGVHAQNTSPLPVMLWIFGGGNQIGTNIGFTFFYDMETLTVQGTVIGITMNYRLNSLGFLSTDDDVAPGNQAMFDHIAAMQWVQDNIANFGGDPTKVTIFGESAGGGSVSLHMISPLSQPLFLRGISESGCIPSTWTYSTSGLSKAMALGKKLDCPVTTTAALVECLRYKPLKLLISSGIGTGWGTVVDGYFLPSDPKFLVNTSIHKDYLIGHNSMEGHGLMSGLFPALNLPESVPGSNMNRDDVRRAARIYDYNVPDHVSEAVAYKYIDWNEPESAYLWPRLAITAIATDWTFAMGSFANAEIRSQYGGSGNTFVYVFGENSHFRLFPDWVESNHLREMVYTFGHPFEDGRFNERFTDSDRALSRAMMTYWTNFAWSGDPNYPNKADTPVMWPSYTVDDKISILLNTSIYDNPDKHIRYNYMGDRYHMWRQILYSMLDLPLDTCPAQEVKDSVRMTLMDDDSRENVLLDNHQSQMKSTTNREACPQSDLVRNTTVGCVEGTEHNVNGSIIERYLGIPYAEPPVGSLRFKNPEEKKPWAGVRLATTFSKICPQAPYFNSSMDEDCLYLNVYIPQRNISKPLAVMVWLHGGGNQVGDGMESYQGDVLALCGDIIVVAVNYRLGSLGFLTTDDDSSRGNYGLFDQHMALLWVKSNIGNFDGDPDRITIAGQSAGAEDAHYHTLSPMSDVLSINRVILESAAGMPTDDMKQKDTALRLAEAASCPTTGSTYDLVECLRDLSIQDLIAAQAATLVGFYPTIDGVFLPDHPRILASDQSRAELWTHLMGANDGDGSVGWSVINDVTDEDGYHQAIYKRFNSEYGWRTGSIDEQYARYQDAGFLKDEQNIQKSLIEAFGDEMFIFPMHKLAIDYSQSGSAVYFYYFTYAPEADGILAPPAWIGARHSSEIPFLFGTILMDPEQDDLAKDLSLLIMRFWSNFMKTGDPNIDENGSEDDNSITWPIYQDRRTDRNYIELNLGDLTAAKSNLRATDDAFWNDYMVRQNAFCESTSPPQVNVTEPPQPDLDHPVVMTDHGAIQGMRITNELFDMHVFLGIPYAEPPVGNLRFEKPANVIDWPKILDATEPKPPCMHLNKKNDVIGSEDCLYLDIFRRSGIIQSGSELVPILIWIHGDSMINDNITGGSFWSGGGSPGWDEDVQTQIDPSYLANFGNMMIIRPNFRIGSLGFLATDDGQIEGNFGLWDLKAVVDWATEFGELFGGDPTQITVMGQGSGAVLAELLGILPSTSKQVARVISQSGSAFSPWAFYNNDCECSHTVKDIASSIKCEGNNGAFLNCLQSIPAEDLVGMVPYRPPNSDSQSESYNNWGTWRLRRDGFLIPQTDLNVLFADSAFDFISGTTSHEFFVELSSSLFRNTSLNDGIHQTYRFLANSNSSNWPPQVGSLLVHSYTPWENTDDKNLGDESMVLYYTDLMFQSGSSHDLNEKLRSKNGSIYQYVLTKPSARLPATINANEPSWLGGIHGDDIAYLFGNPVTSPVFYSDLDREFSRKMMTYWSNFIRSGDPNSRGLEEWLSYSEGTNYLDLDGSDRRNLLVKTAGYNIEKSALWNEVIPLLYTGDSRISAAVKVGISSLSEGECTAAEISIGSGIGLDLSAEDADTTIYVLFSMCLVLGAFLICLLVIRYLISR